MVFRQSVDEPNPGVVQCRLSERHIEESETPAIVAGPHLPKRLFSSRNDLLLYRFSLMTGLFDALSGQCDLSSTFEPLHAQVGFDLPLLCCCAINIGTVQSAIRKGQRKPGYQSNIPVAVDTWSSEDGGIGARVGLLKSIVRVCTTTPRIEYREIDGRQICLLYTSPSPRDRG